MNVLRVRVFVLGRAETSLTVDGIIYVVDTGLCKLKVYNPRIGELRHRRDVTLFLFCYILFCTYAATHCSIITHY